jgi:hypothetical protein
VIQCDLRYNAQHWKHVARYSLFCGKNYGPSDIPSRDLWRWHRVSIIKPTTQLYLRNACRYSSKQDHTLASNDSSFYSIKRHTEASDSSSWLKIVCGIIISLMTYSRVSSRRFISGGGWIRISSRSSVFCVNQYVTHICTLRSSLHSTNRLLSNQLTQFTVLFLQTIIRWTGDCCEMWNIRTSPRSLPIARNSSNGPPLSILRIYFYWWCPI